MRVHHFEPRVELGGPFLVMEYLPWSTGEQWISDAGSTGLPVEAVLEVGRHLCAALEYAHGRGVLHLDIKPSNVFVDAAGERAKLADFGISRVLSTAGHKVLPLEQAGTPSYMAPEQRMPGMKLGPATDLYQLAATLWDLLTGKPPSFSIDHSALPQDKRGHVLRALCPALAYDPSARTPSAGMFRELLT